MSMSIDERVRFESAERRIAELTRSLEQLQELVLKIAVKKPMGRPKKHG